MKRSAVFFLPAVFCLLIALAMPQTHFPTPPESMNPQTSDHPVPTNRKIDLAQAQREADDLARTAQTIPSDVASVRRGMLPKDAIEKLKQIEKLSKHLRAELNP